MLGVAAGMTNRTLNSEACTMAFPGRSRPCTIPENEEIPRTVLNSVLETNGNEDERAVSKLQRRHSDVKVYKEFCDFYAKFEASNSLFNQRNKPLLLSLPELLSNPQQDNFPQLSHWTVPACEMFKSPVYNGKHWSVSVSPSARTMDCPGSVVTGLEPGAAMLNHEGVASLDQDVFGICAPNADSLHCASPTSSPGIFVYE
ncbi:LIM and senescent cell antigen-like-containing domain protein 1 isoform 1 [Cricetulus griseus]|uniref:LIM and senescent cell antigen-like-containing domain protein 1 isoform 1 n=1 Tax=Cricetulus griseus TaxID=10029 RepID=A0A061INR5_CRIGR|nr:LIM and senescent cell antigen-like-containing domain protein 1 isoform 1 [Cricetulus griseus]